LFFYAAWNAAYLPLLLGSILFNYLIATYLARTGTTKARAWLPAIAVAVNLGFLGYFKYAGYFVATVNAAAGTDLTWQTVILPLGISFYTFQQLTLLLDIGSGQVKEVRFRDFLLFVIFFPHLIAGPIVHHREMMPQFQTADYRLNWTNLATGFVLLMMGLVKKAVLADGIAEHVTPIFAAAVLFRLGRRHRVYVADVFRLQRVLGHGPGTRADDRHPVADELRLAAEGVECRGLLVALAYYIDAIPDRQSL
jgi:alginate O-acetyltransferase complex protein AlgI